MAQLLRAIGSPWYRYIGAYELRTCASGSIHAQLMACAQEHRVDHFYEARHLYNRVVTLRASATEYPQRLAGASSVALVLKALAARQITTLEYQMELMLLRESLHRWLALEDRHHEALAELFKCGHKNAAPE